jgi:acetyl-CoA acetyltransferase
MGVKRDNNIRTDTSLEQLAKLKPVFDRGPGGTLTAGNSTPLTDGASAVLLGSEDWARAHGLPISAYLTYAREAAVDFVNKEGLLMAPAYAVSEMLTEAKLALQDFDFYEIHEAFAAQTLVTLKAWSRSNSAASDSAATAQWDRSIAASSTSKAAASRSAIRSRRPAPESSRRSRSFCANGAAAAA